MAMCHIGHLLSGIAVLTHAQKMTSMSFLVILGHLKKLFRNKFLARLLAAAMSSTPHACLPIQTVHGGLFSWGFPMLPLGSAPAASSMTASLAAPDLAGCFDGDDMVSSGSCGFAGFPALTLRLGNLFRGSSLGCHNLHANLLSRHALLTQRCSLVVLRRCAV